MKRERNWFMIGIGLFLVVFVSVVFTNAWFEYEQLRISQSIYYDPDAQREIVFFGVSLVTMGALLIVIGWIGPIQVPVDRPRGE